MLILRLLRTRGYLFLGQHNIMAFLHSVVVHFWLGVRGHIHGEPGVEFVNKFKKKLVAGLLTRSPTIAHWRFPSACEGSTQHHGSWLRWFCILVSVQMQLNVENCYNVAK